jgi:hypothetical protein
VHDPTVGAERTLRQVAQARIVVDDEDRFGTGPGLGLASTTHRNPVGLARRLAAHRPDDSSHRLRDGYGTEVDPQRL